MMGWTKRQFVLQAFEEIGLANYTFDLQPEQLNSALYKLDAMLATWNGLGIRLGYPLPSSPQEGTLDTQTNVPDSANEAIYTNLAIRIASGFGKTVLPDTKITARAAYLVLLQRATLPQEMQVRGLPSGAGNKPWASGEEYIDEINTNLQAGADSDIILE